MFYYCFECKPEIVLARPGLCATCFTKLEKVDAIGNIISLVPKFIELNIEETKAIVKELGSTFIDRENPLYQEVLNKMIAFLKQNEK